MFVKAWQNSQENTFLGVAFYLQSLGLKPCYKETSKGTFFLKTFTEHLQISTPPDSSVPTMFYSLSIILEFVQKVYENEDFNIFFNIYMNAFKTMLPLQ